MSLIDNAFEIEEGISIDGNIWIGEGTDDPSLIGKDAPVGSIYLRNGVSNELFQKTTSIATGWVKLTTKTYVDNAISNIVSSKNEVYGGNVLADTRRRLVVSGGGASSTYAPFQMIFGGLA
jgi:hypothetical protein